MHLKQLEACFDSRNRGGHREQSPAAMLPWERPTPDQRRDQENRVHAQWSRKAYYPANQLGTDTSSNSFEWNPNAPYEGHTDAAAPPAMLNRVGTVKIAPPALRGKGWATLDPDEDLPPTLVETYGASPLVGISSSASAPTLAQTGKGGLTRDGASLERNGTDIHEGRPWRRSVPYAPNPNYDGGAAAATENASNDIFGSATATAKRHMPIAQGSSRDATDIHEGRPWRRSVPSAPDSNYGVGDPNPHPPHMRSSVDTVVYGRDMDMSATEILTDGKGAADCGWSMARKASDLRVGEKARLGHEEFRSIRAPEPPQMGAAGERNRADETHLFGHALLAPEELKAAPSAPKARSDVTRETRGLDVAHDLRIPTALPDPPDMNYPMHGHQVRALTPLATPIAALPSL